MSEENQEELEDPVSEQPEDDGSPLHSVAREHDMPSRTARSGHACVSQLFHGRVSFLVELVDDACWYMTNMSFNLTMADKDTMTLKQALSEPDAEDFVKAMEQEVDDHVKRGHWVAVTIHQMQSAEAV